MTNSVRNSDRPMITWLGGADCVPSAWRISDSTMTMRVKPVIIKRMAGRKDSAVKNSRVWMGTEKLVPPLPWPMTSGRLAGAPCAQEARGVAQHSASAAAPAAWLSVRAGRLQEYSDIRTVRRQAARLRHRSRKISRGRGLQHMQALDALRRDAQHQTHGLRALAHFHRHHPLLDRKSTRLNSSHLVISYAVFCLK